MPKNWLFEVARLFCAAAVVAVAVNSFNSVMKVELDQAKKSLQVVSEEKVAAEYRLVAAESHTRELERQLEEAQAVKETLGELADAVKKSNEKAKTRKLPPSTRSIPQPEKAMPAPTEPESKDGGEKMATGYAERMVEELNKVRRDHLVGPVTWSNELSEAAGVWGRELIKNGCTLKHDPAKKHGENLAKGYRTPEAAVAEWAGEEKDYDYSSNTCADGKVCGHYTQIVWADTTEVGCQQYDCPADKQPVLVCRFFPAGNVIGQKPY
jgi:pathogenesis-related protein 1